MERKKLKIKLSRHAKRRAKLYKIHEREIINILNNTPLLPGKNEIVKKVKELHLPLKIVYLFENDEVVVITNYPLKKEKKT